MPYLTGPTGTARTRQRETGVRMLGRAVGAPSAGRRRPLGYLPAS